MMVTTRLTMRGGRDANGAVGRRFTRPDCAHQVGIKGRRPWDGHGGGDERERDRGI